MINSFIIWLLRMPYWNLLTLCSIFYCIQHFYTLHYVFGIAVQACSLLTCVVTGCETAHLSTFSDLSCSLVSHDKDWSIIMNVDFLSREYWTLFTLILWSICVLILMVCMHLRLFWPQFHWLLQQMQRLTIVRVRVHQLLRMEVNANI